MHPLLLAIHLIALVPLAATAGRISELSSLSQQLVLQEPLNKCRGGDCEPLSRASLFLDHPSRYSLAGLLCAFQAPSPSPEKQQHKSHLGTGKLAAMPPAKEEAPPKINYEINVPTRVLPEKEGFRSCTVKLLEHTFVNSYGHPYIGKYSPSLFDDPVCKDPSEWQFIELTVEGSVSGRQFDRLGSIQLDGIEVLRTDNPEPSTNITQWKFSKEMNRYYDVFRKDRNLVFDFPNIVNDVYTGSLAMTVSFTAYVADAPSPHRKLSEASAIVLPLSKQNQTDNSFFALGGDGTTPADDGITKLRFPPNARSALVEIYASGTATDEFWYSNIPDKIYNQVGGDAASLFYPRGPYREIQVLIDGRLAGFAMPFPVVFTGGINPLLWRPSVAFGAFDQPTYLVDITPFLGQLTDDAEHEIQLKVVSAEESQEIDASWFVSGNVQVFLDKSDTRTTGRITSYNAPTAGNFSTAGYVKGNVSEDGTLRAEVRLDSPRRLSIEAELRTGSSEEDIAVSWSQSADFYSITTQQGPSSTTDQEAKGSHQSFHGKDLYLQYGFDFPIKISLYQTKDVINATINHAYNVTQQFHDNATLEPSFFRLTTEQKAEASVTLKDGQSTAGDGTTLTILDYSDDLGNTFGRRNIGHNRSVESDLFYGSLASKAGRVK